MNKNKSKTPEPEGLDRFLCAQDAGLPFGRSDCETALLEVKEGRKETHWIWYVFPQLKGLGTSAMCERFGIRGLKEAEEYFCDPVLCPRLVEITEALLAHSENRTAREIFGDCDALKVRSCMTLFSRALKHNRSLSVGTSPTEVNLFDRVIKEFYSGECDPLTDRMIDAELMEGRPEQQYLF